MVGKGEHIGPDLAEWRRLFFEFAGLRSEFQSAAIREWARLLSEFASVRNALQAAVGQPSASRCTFNVFEVTHRRGFEVTTHSALLCNLLDPRGSHGQGGAFLEGFLEILDTRLSADVSKPPWPPADGWWSATPEFPAEQGRLDIVLTNRGPYGPATIVIENKWPMAWEMDSYNAMPST